MAWYWVAVIGFCCFILGGLLMACCCMARDADDRMMRMREEGDEWLLR
jgi:hypothetical protein